MPPTLTCVTNVSIVVRVFDEEESEIGKVVDTESTKQHGQAKLDLGLGDGLGDRLKHWEVVL